MMVVNTMLTVVHFHSTLHCLTIQNTYPYVKINLCITAGPQRTPVYVLNCYL